MVEVDRRLLEAEPADDRQVVAILVTDAQERLPYTPGEDAEARVVARRGRCRESASGSGSRCAAAAVRKRDSLATPTPCEDDVVALLGLGIEVGDQLRRLLQVTVHYDRPVATTGCQARRDRSLLTEVPAQTQGAHVLVLPRQLEDDLPCAVWAAIVDEDDLVVGRHARERRRQALVQRAHAVAAAIGRDDHADLGLGCGERHSGAPAALSPVRRDTAVRRPGGSTRRGL